MTIRLRDIWPISEVETYKLHFARWNQESQPLDVWLRDRKEWQGWQEYRPARNDFNRPLILSVMQFYHEPDTWLFGGIYRVLERLPDRYVVDLESEGAAFIGRLKLRSDYKQRATRVNFENHYASFEVAEILPEPYSGRSFPGFEGVDLSFEELEGLVRKGRSDWRSALQSVKGIYLITDASRRRRYVGAAYGDGGIWSRWCAYVETGHGGNVELRQLLEDAGIEHFRGSLRFALLETRSVATSDDIILQRETFWKQILLTRGEEGYNRN